MNYQEMLEECQRLNKLPRKSSNPKDDVFYVVAPTDHKNLNEYKKRLFDEKSSINPPDNIYKVKYQDEKVIIYTVGVSYKLGALHSLDFKPYKSK